MAAHAGVPDQVEIHLSAGGLGASTMSIRKRSITLDSDNPALPIGRASKVFAKGFVAAEDNGWFDSPVMSRTHAEIVANLAEQRVQLRDLGSLHGTYLNGKEGKLPAQELCDLKDGDELAFGLPILRGPDEYLPITVKVGIAFKTSRSYDTSTFQVPDGSDCSDCSSDESDYSSDSSDASGASGASARSITHLDGSNPLCKPACASEVIDLTEGPEDADDEHQAQEIIDLSSPPSSPPPSSPIPDLIDQEASSDIDELQEEDEDLEIELDGIDSTDAGPSFDAQTRGILDAVEQLAEPLIFDDHFSFMNLIRDGQDEYDGSDVSEGESYVEYPDDASSGSEASSDEEVDYESDGSGESESGLGEAMEEDEPSGEDEDSDESVTSDRDSIKGTHWDASAPELMNCPVPELVDRPVLCGLPVPYLTPASTTTANPPFRIQELLNEGAADTGRCPASSDVQERIHSGNLHSTQPYVANNTAVEQLGIKTGKAEFFAAREDNKATLSAYKSSAAQSTTAHRRHTSSIYTLCNDQETPEYQFQSAAPANATASKASDSSQKLPSVYSMVEDISDKRPLQLPSEPVNGYHMESFGRVHPPVPSKTTDPEPVKIFAPEPFKASTPEPFKASTPEPFKVSTPEPFKASTPEPFKVSTPEPAKTVGVSVGLVAQDPRRTGVAISDIVESHQSSTPKRKADDISGVTTQEEKWAAIMSDESQSAVVPEPARESSPADTIVSSLEAQPATADLITQAVAVQYNGNLVKASPTGERPVKRMRLRHLAESVGMAALGGVMVMGALIYSAPTFA